jgi:heme exporter protein B
LILPLIVLPLLSPAVIFGAGAAEGAGGALLFLAAFSFAACVLSPFATAASVRLNLAS